jgi:hypothetical protein
MSEAHAGHDAHGHGHPEGFTPNQKSVALAVFVIAALLATGFFLVKRGEYLQRHAPGAAHPAVARQAEAAPSPRAEREVVFPPGQLGARMRFAAGLQRRFRRRGRELTIQATGKEGAVFQMTYAASAPDQKHIDQLQRAEGLQRDLRARGFTKLSIRIGDREVYGKDL